MIPMLKVLFTDEAAFRRWGRGALMGVGGYLLTLSPADAATIAAMLHVSPHTLGVLTMVASVLVTSSRRTQS